MFLLVKYRMEQKKKRQKIWTLQAPQLILHDIVSPFCGLARPISWIVNEPNRS